MMSIETMRERITALEQDNQEQCRLNAMGAEREARLMARVKVLEKDCCQLIDERDERDEVIDALMTQVLGSDCKEWSSAYGFNDAVVDVEGRMKELEKDAARYRWIKNKHNDEDSGIFVDDPDEWGAPTPIGWPDIDNDLDEAIDTAMQKD